MFNTIQVLLNRRDLNEHPTFLGKPQLRDYKYGDPLEELPTTYRIEAGTPTRAAEAIVKLCTMEGLHDADGNTWPEGEREFGIGDVLIITNDEGATTIYGRTRYSWHPLSENQLPYPEPADPV